MCRIGKILVYRSPPGTHQACNQQAGLQLCGWRATNKVWSAADHLV